MTHYTNVMSLVTTTKAENTDQLISDLCHHIDIYMWVNVGSANGFVRNDKKPLPETKLTYQQWISVAITLGQFNAI